MSKPFIQRFREAVTDSDELSGTDKGVLQAMARFANSEGRQVRPSRETLSKSAGFSRRTVNYALKRLEAAGWIRKETSGQASRTPSEYSLHIPLGQMKTSTRASDDTFTRATRASSTPLPRIPKDIPRDIELDSYDELELILGHDIAEQYARCDVPRSSQDSPDVKPDSKASLEAEFARMWALPEPEPDEDGNIPSKWPEGWLNEFQHRLLALNGRIERGNPPRIIWD